MSLSASSVYIQYSVRIYILKIIFGIYLHSSPYFNFYQIENGQTSNIFSMVVLQVKKGELAKDMCTLIAILSGFIEDRPTNNLY